MKSAVLTVGTEITSGEITNRNSAWISGQLEHLGISVLFHISVPDDRPLILQALKTLEKTVDLIMVTGGLGPTSDDFTREVIADYVNQPLEFDQKTFEDLKSLYQRRGLPLREAHRQQCYFPKTSTLLLNPVGTAHGFLVETPLVKIAVLPGPPREVEGVFNQDFLTHLKTLNIKPVNELTVLKCLGVPESEVAELVEKELKPFGFVIGYRASHPYVYVKIWHPLNDTAFLPLLKKVLKPWLIETDLAQDFLTRIPPDSLILDQASEGILSSRLQPHFKLRSDWTLILSHQNFEDFHFLLKSDPEGFLVRAVIQDQELSEVIPMPFKMVSDSERGRVYMVEHALKIFVKWLNDSNR